MLNYGINSSFFFVVFLQINFPKSMDFLHFFVCVCVKLNDVQYKMALSLWNVCGFGTICR